MRIGNVILNVSVSCASMRCGQKYKHMDVWAKLSCGHRHLHMQLLIDIHTRSHSLSQFSPLLVLVFEVVLLPLLVLPLQLVSAVFSFSRAHRTKLTTENVAVAIYCCWLLFDHRRTFWCSLLLEILVFREVELWVHRRIARTRSV